MWCVIAGVLLVRAADLSLYEFPVRFALLSLAVVAAATLGVLPVAAVILFDVA